MEDSFPTHTNWTMIFRARTEHPGRRKDALQVIARRYWGPVYSYFLRKFGDVHKAEDLTQGFFADIVFGKDLPRQADPARGRLRALLLTALKHYAGGIHRCQTAAKRQPPGGEVSLEGRDDGTAPEPAAGATPEQAFMFTWASTLIAETVKEVKDECLRKGQEAHWEIFSAIVLRPILEGADPVPNAELRAKYGLSNDQDVSNRAETVARKYRRVFRAKVRALVESPDEVDAEIDELIRICADFRASS